MNKASKTTLALCTATLLLAAAGPAISAEEAAKPTGDMSIAVLSKYVWRGYELSKDSLVIQPSLTASYMGFGFNLWGNLDTDQSKDLFDEDGANWNETDMTLSYDNSVGMVGYSLGYIYYGLEGAPDTQEIYGSLSLDTLLSPTLTVYRDFAKYPGWYVTLGVSHSFQLSETLSLEAGGHVSYLKADDADTLADPDDPTSSYSDFHDGQVYLSLNVPVTEHIAVTPQIYYSFALSGASSDVIKAASANGKDDDFLYGGISVSMSF